MNFEEIKSRYFLSSANEEEARTILLDAVNAAFEFLRPRTGEKICSDIALTDLEQIFSETEIPFAPAEVRSVFNEALTKVVPHSVRVSDPRFIGHMTGAVPYIGLLADLLISALNQNVVKIETALSASFVEKQVLTWLHQLIYKKPNSFYKNVMHRVDLTLGNVTNGGTMGNLTALTVARNRLLPNAGSEGLVEALADRGLKRVVILASKRVHYSVKKAAAVLGIGSKNVLEIPVCQGTNRISIGDLEATISNLERRKTGILAIVGIAGTTETGNIDNLETLAAIAANHGIWFHVDAAWGGALLLADESREKLAGIEQADSVAVDGHKLFYLPMSHGAVLFKNEYDLDAIRHSANYIIRPGSVDLGRTSLEGSRRFDSFKLWFFLKTLGRQGYSALLDHSVKLTQTFASLIRQHDCFELTSEPETNILTYRYLPSGWTTGLREVRQRLLLLQNDPMSEKDSQEFVRFAHGVEEFLNDVNIELQKQQRLSGRSFVSRTVLESVHSGTEVVVLRSVLLNPFTTPEILADILSEQASRGHKISAQKWKQARITAPSCVAPFFEIFLDSPSDFRS